MGNPLAETNCITRLLWLKFEFESTLLPLELVVENGMGLGLVRSRRGQVSSWFLLDLKKLDNKKKIVFFPHVSFKPFKSNIYIYIHTHKKKQREVEKHKQSKYVNYWFMCIVCYETPTSKVLSKAKHVATLQNIPYFHSSQSIVFLDLIVQNEC